MINFSCNNEKNTPNIILIMAEDISTDLEVYGTEGLQTPNLNKMSENGELFKRFYATSPICSPNRSAIMTGVHQVKLNSHNHRSNRNYVLPDPYKPITYWLRKNGYTCLLGAGNELSTPSSKYDVNFKVKPTGEWDGKEKFGLFDESRIFNYQDQPFFSQISLSSTHRSGRWDEVRSKSLDPVNVDEISLPPYMADNEIIKLDWATHLDQIEYIDQQIGQIFQILKEKKLLENSIVIFIAENGRCNIRGKGYLFEPGIKIPLIIHNPFNNKKGKINNKLVDATDLSATILDYAGISIPDYMTGSSFINNSFDRNYVFSARDQWDEIFDKSRSITTNQWKYIKNYKPELPYDIGQAYLEFNRPPVHIMRKLKNEGSLTESQLHFFKSKKPDEELYDLKNDPHELINLAKNSEYENKILEFRKQLSELEIKYSPISDENEPIIAAAPKVLDWMKKNKKNLYNRMVNGERMIYSKIKSEYDKSFKN